MMTGKRAATGMVRTCILLLASAAALAAAVPAGGAQQGPRIAVAEPRYDFGVVEAGAVLEHVFEIRNAGDVVLEIGEITTS